MYVRLLQAVCGILQGLIGRMCKELTPPIGFLKPRIYMSCVSPQIGDSIQALHTSILHANINLSNNILPHSAFKMKSAIALGSFLFPLLSIASYEYPYIEGYQTQCGGLVQFTPNNTESGAVGDQTWNVNIAVSDLIVNGVECQVLESHLTNQGLNPQNYNCDKSWNGPTWAAVITSFDLAGPGNSGSQIAAAINAGAPSGRTPCNNCCDPMVEEVGKKH